MPKRQSSASSASSATKTAKKPKKPANLLLGALGDWYAIAVILDNTPEETLMPWITSTSVKGNLVRVSACARLR